jgi:hypothetical protein
MRNFAASPLCASHSKKFLAGALTFTLAEYLIVEDVVFQNLTATSTSGIL